MKMQRDDLISILKDFEDNGLILYSPEQDAYLSLAMSLNRMV
jgi:hypothetical protein